MSIEQSLERIAIAIEKLVGQDQTRAAKPIDPPAEEKKPRKQTAPLNAPVIKPETAVAEFDPFAETAVNEEQLTFDVLKEALIEHALKFGNKTSIALIIKHGADSASPKIATIPKVNWTACYTEVKADLAKVKK